MPGMTVVIQKDDTFLTGAYAGVDVYEISLYKPDHEIEYNVLYISRQCSEQK